MNVPQLAENICDTPPGIIADVTERFRACGYFFLVRRATAEAAITVIAAAAGAEVPVVGEPFSFALSADKADVTAEVVGVVVPAEDVPADEAVADFDVVAAEAAEPAAAVSAEVSPGGSGRSIAVTVVGIVTVFVTDDAVVYVTVLVGVVSMAPWLP